MADDANLLTQPNPDGGNNSPNPTPNKKKQKRKPNEKINRPWIAPIILGGMGTLTLIISGLQGQWHEWWVEWLLIPASLLAVSIGIYEFLADRLKLEKLWAILMASFSFVLIGGGVLVAYKVTYKKPDEPKPVVAVEAKNVGWQPPEMSADCANVIVYLGGQEFIFPRLNGQSTDSVSPEKKISDDATPVYSGNVVGYINSAINSPKKNAAIFPGSDKNVTLFSESENGDSQFNITLRVSRDFIDCPVTPYIKNNRLFVLIKMPANNENKAISLEDNLDSEIPPNWDRNYSSNAFEIVREDKLPVFQVIYRRPNEIQVNGIFIVNSNCICSAFGDHLDISYFYNADGSLPDISPLLDDPNILPNSITNLEMAYAMTYSNQNAIFKYPAWRHLGDFENQ